MKTLVTIFFCLLVVQAGAQRKQHNYLYQYGIADAFLAGLYKGELTVKDMKTHGDFGLGAPDMLDGELIILNGKPYKTTANGTTMILPDTTKVPLVISTNFKADTSFYIDKMVSKKDVLAIIDKYLLKANGLYAIRISGQFETVKTRAFPPVSSSPNLPLAQMLDRQHFFNYPNIAGTLVGFKLPQYLSSVTIADYHFHFLSADKTRGGHMTDMSISKVKVEIANLQGVIMQIPQDADFQQFDFKKVKKGDAEKAEKQ